MVSEVQSKDRKVWGTITLAQVSPGSSVFVARKVFFCQSVSQPMLPFFARIIQTTNFFGTMLQERF